MDKQTVLYAIYFLEDRISKHPIKNEIGYNNPKHLGGKYDPVELRESQINDFKKLLKEMEYLENQLKELK